MFCSCSQDSLYDTNPKNARSFIESLQNKFFKMIKISCSSTSSNSSLYDIQWHPMTIHLLHGLICFPKKKRVAFWWYLIPPFPLPRFQHLPTKIHPVGFRTTRTNRKSRRILAYFFKSWERSKFEPISHLKIWMFPEHLIRCVYLKLMDIYIYTRGSNQVPVSLRSFNTTGYNWWTTILTSCTWHQRSSSSIVPAKLQRMNFEIPLYLNKCICSF